MPKLHLHVFWLYFSNNFNRTLRIKLKIPQDKEEPKKRKVSLPDQVQMSFLKETDTDFSALHAKLEANIKDEMDEGKRRVREDCSFVSSKHQQMKSRLLHRLLAFLQQNERKYEDFLQPVVIGEEAVPSFF